MNGRKIFYIMLHGCAGGGGFRKKKWPKKLGIGLHSLNKIECGELPTKLGVEVLFRIDREFGIDPQTLLEQELR